MLKRALGKLRDGLVSLAYPEMCRVCGEPVESWTDGIACENCWNDPLKTRLLSNRPVCDKCGAPLDPAPEKKLCGWCEPDPYVRARSCGIYAGTLEASVLFLKTHPHVCGRLRALIARSYAENRDLLASDLIIPIPLAPARRRERGFNQAAIIAKSIQPEAGAELDENSLVRVKHTERHRAGMDRLDRARSVERAFKVARPRAIERASILLVDDLLTTGSTVVAAAAALLEAGADRVNVFTLARVWRV